MADELAAYQSEERHTSQKDQDSGIVIVESLSLCLKFNA